MDVPSSINCLKPTIPWQQFPLLKKVNYDHGICLSLCYYLCHQYLLIDSKKMPMLDFYSTYFKNMNEDGFKKLIALNYSYESLLYTQSDKGFASEVEQFITLYPGDERINFTYICQANKHLPIEQTNTIVSKLYNGEVCLLGIKLSETKGHALAVVANIADDSLWLFDPSQGFFKIPDQRQFFNFLKEYLRLNSTELVDAICMSYTM